MKSLSEIYPTGRTGKPFTRLALKEVYQERSLC